MTDIMYAVVLLLIVFVWIRNQKAFEWQTELAHEFFTAQERRIDEWFSNPETQDLNFSHYNFTDYVESYEAMIFKFWIWDKTKFIKKAFNEAV